MVDFIVDFLFDLAELFITLLVDKKRKKSN